ncbi:MAG: TIGR01212 family radical SAM protein [Desulfobacterales bacterium]|jgi:radical SAM protein (TIGR01212 family)
MTPFKRYNDYNTYLRNVYGCRVQKISVDAGLTCPNRDGTLSTAGCIYCNARGSGTGAHAGGHSITEQLLAGKTALSRRYKAKKFIAYFQSFSNTYAPVSKLRRLYDEALAVDDVVGLSIGTRPDCVAAPVLDLLAGYAADHLVWIEYGLQSAHDTTLALINRGHDVACFQEAVNSTQARGLKVCAHVILGLPQENRAQMLATARFLAGLPVAGVKLHLLYVVRGTPLERLYRAGTYRCLSQAAYVELVCDFLEYLPDHVVIQRLTGDPHPAELVAPKWSLRKRETLDMMKTTLEQRDTWQGKRLGCSRT